MTCGRTIDWQANVCPYCGHDFRALMGPPGPPKTSKPVAGGILIVIAGLLALAMSVTFVVLDPTDMETWGYNSADYEGLSLSELDEMLAVCGAVGIVLSIIAVVGGAFALMRRGFGFAIVGGICGIIGIGFGLGALLALIGVILVAVSKNEF